MAICEICKQKEAIDMGSGNRWMCKKCDIEDIKNSCWECQKCHKLLAINKKNRLKRMPSTIFEFVLTTAKKVVSGEETKDKAIRRAGEISNKIGEPVYVLRNLGYVHTWN